MMSNLNKVEHPFTVSFNTTYFVNAVDEEDALAIASLAALGMDQKVAMNGEIDINEADIKTGHNYTIEHNNNQ
jgi:hypothetical protein